jgi:hypothetical protein
MSSATTRKQRMLNFRKRKAGTESIESKKPKVDVGKNKSGKRGVDSPTENFVPGNIHLMVNYAEKGRSNKTLSRATLSAAEKVAKECDVPKNFSFGSATYGPLSGLTHEERLVSCFLSGKIETKKVFKLTANMKRTASTLAGCGYSEKESKRAAWLSGANLNSANELLSS